MKKISILCLLLFVTALCQAQSSEIFCTEDGALRGYDVVAFFKMDKAIQGKKEIFYSWNNAVWHFSDEVNKNAFIANPESFIPQYGGYCAYGTAEGHKAPTLPETWTVIDKKLYFNYNMDVKKHWAKNKEELIKKADQNWPSVKKME